jgi:hypothetical protein
MSQRTDHPSTGSELALNAVKGQALVARLRDESAALVAFFAAFAPEQWERRSTPRAHPGPRTTCWRTWSARSGA